MNKLMKYAGYSYSLPVYNSALEPSFCPLSTADSAHRYTIYVRLGIYICICLFLSTRWTSAAKIVVCETLSRSHLAWLTVIAIRNTRRSAFSFHRPSFYGLFSAVSTPDCSTFLLLSSFFSLSFYFVSMWRTVSGDLWPWLLSAACHI